MNEAPKTRLSKAAPWIALPLVAAVAFGLGGLLFRGSESPTAGDETHAHEAAETIWTCAMHPQIRQTEPGQCPICGMDLIPVEQGAAKDQGDGRRGLAFRTRQDPRAGPDRQSGAPRVRTSGAATTRTRRLR